jgi:hypothetical protein
VNINIKYENSETKYFDKLTQSEILSDKSIKPDGYLTGGLLESYIDKINEWKEANFRLSIGPKIQSPLTIEMLARGILEGGALNPKFVLDLKPDELYFDGEKYYNADEASYWLFGYASYRVLDFNRYEGQAFASTYLNASKYLPGNSSFSNTINDAPWLIKAFNDGLGYSDNDGLKHSIDPLPLYEPYILNASFLPEGTGLADMIEVGLWVYPAAGINKKTVKLARNALTSAYINWQIQIAIRMICGMPFKEAVTDVDYSDVTWYGLTSLLSSDKEILALYCLRAGINTFQETREMNLEVGESCLIEMLQTFTIKKLIGDPKSIYGKYLYENLKKKNHSKSELLRNICIIFNCESDTALEIMRLIPEVTLNTLADDLKE